MSEDSKQVLDRKASDNEYLHKDFHGALCYSIHYLDQEYGREATREYLEQVGRTFYAPLSQGLRERGLGALEEHWRDIFSTEDGQFSLHYENKTLVLTVQQCPAIAHLQTRGQLFTKRHCETTTVVNETVCRQAGYRSTCAYEPGRGRCVQRFWKDERE